MNGVLFISDLELICGFKGLLCLVVLIVLLVMTSSGVRWRQLM